MTRRDTPITGFLAGLGTLLLGVSIVYLLLYRLGQDVSLHDFWEILRIVPDQAAKILSLALIAEIIPITLVKRRRLDNAARGLFVVIMLCAALILWLKFVA